MKVVRICLGSAPLYILDLDDEVIASVREADSGLVAARPVSRGRAQVPRCVLYGMGHRSVGTVTSKTFSEVKRIQTQRAMTQAGQCGGLLDVLARFKGCDATDPWDKIYGLGFSSQSCAIGVDYRKSTAEIYTDVATAEINASANLDIIT
ncbi:hypothetical protein V501_03896 [Pseudogymnoascus sp. VKM F-4519 (FW-2642)]|nr:hypothetical protein V501_03896 [Pseudogymnoascus sp. VKM F-4519 (FW-2642)]